MRISALLATISLASGIALAQEPRPAFDAVSLRPASGQPMLLANGATLLGGLRGGPGSDDPEHISGNSVTVSALIRRAYGVTANQISGPDWIDAALYDIAVKVPFGATPDQLNLMFQQLLEDRFGLKVHHATGVLTGYNLVAAKEGVKLKKWLASDSSPDSIGIAPASALEKRTSMVTNGRQSRGFSARAVPIATLVTMLRSQLGGTLVVDKTGLDGNFDYRIDFAPVKTSSDDAAPYATLFTALERDFGLKLEPANFPLDTIVIDHIDHPSAN